MVKATNLHQCWQTKEKGNDMFLLITENNELSVMEDMTPLRWNPSHQSGFQWDGKQRIALTSYGAFGADYNRARVCADKWCERAKQAWEELKK